MKKLGAILCLSLMIIFMTTAVSFAGGLTLLETFPEEGNAELTPQNVAVKLIFSEKISDPASVAANSKRFAITDAEGKKIEFEPLYNEEKYPNEVWLQISETLEQNTAYKVTVSEGMQSSTGNTLDEAITLNFATRNTKADSKVYMLLMVAMMAGMMVFTVLETKRRMKKEESEKEDRKVNPYKEARRTGKSVEEVVAKTEREKVKAEKRRARVYKKQDPRATERRKPSKPGVKRVKTARAISEKGYATPKSFIEGRLAREQAEAEALERAARSRQSRSKGSKQQQRQRKKK